MINYQKLFSWVQPTIAVFTGLFLGLFVTYLAGESPLHILSILAKSAFGSPYDMGMTLFYATPLVFTGLAVAVAFHGGLFNIGAEGQLTLGALAVAGFGILFPNLSAPYSYFFGAVAGFFAGAVWGAIPGWLKVKRGSHEVINTIMMNFIAAGIVSYLTLYVFKNPESQSPETQPLTAQYLLPKFAFFEGASIGPVALLAVAAAFLVWYFLFYTKSGYELRAVGENESAAEIGGVQSGKKKILAMTLSGGLAGLVGVAEVLGNAGRFRLGFSPDFGFIGIAVALLARNQPIAIIFSALLFGALHKGAGDLDLETENITRDLSLILQALVILSVSANGLWSYFKNLKFKKDIAK